MNPADKNHNEELPGLQDEAHGSLDGEVRGSRIHHRMIDSNVQWAGAVAMCGDRLGLSVVRSVLIVRRGI